MKWSLLLVPFLLLACKQDESEKPLNVIFILVDDMGYADLACYGSPLNETPNLDKLSKEGLKATNFYAAQAVCSASRAAYLTGCYPNRLGIHGALMPNAPIGLNHNEVTIAEILKAHQYTTGIFGKWHLGDHPDYLPLNHGFDEYYGIPYSNDMWPHHPQQGPVFNFGPLPLIENNKVIDTLDDQTNLTVDLTEKSLEFIERNKDTPFFLYLAHPQPHVPLFVSHNYKGKSKNGLYGDVVMELDWSVGQIIGKLEKLNLDKNTLVIFSSDNGPWLSYGEHSGSAGRLREGKGTAWEGGQRVPFIAWAPSIIPANTVLNTPFYAMDLLPTISEATGAQMITGNIDGHSMWENIRNGKEKEAAEVFYYYYKTNELHAIRYNDWKLVFPHTYRSLNGRQGGKDGLPVNYEMLPVEKAELYNLVTDPEEKKNVYAEHLDIVATIETYATQARNDLGDRLTNNDGTGNRTPGKIPE